jgi:integrase
VVLASVMLFYAVLDGIVSILNYRIEVDMALLKHTYKTKDGTTKQTDAWYYRFQMDGKTFFGSTKTANKSLAAKVERAKYEEVLSKAKLGDKPTINVQSALDTFLKSQEKAGEYRNIKTYVQKILGSKKGKNDEVVTIYGLDGDRDFHSINNADVQKLVLARRNENNADATILLELVQLSKAVKLIGRLGYAVSTEIDFKAIKKENQLRPSKAKLRYLTDGEEALLMEALDPTSVLNDETRIDRLEGRDLVVVLLGTGARYSEIANLKWSDVHLGNKGISLYRNKVENESILPMTDNVFDTLTARFKTKRADQVYVFENSDKDGPRKYAPKFFVEACKRAKIAGITLHSLRKTFASRLVQGGLSLYDTSQLLGHKSVNTTSTHYAFLAPSKTSQAAMAILNRRV